MKISKKDLANWIQKIPVFWLAGLTAFYFSAMAAKQIVAYNKEGSELMREHYQMASLVSKKQTWDLRSNWIAQEIPRFETEDQASNFLAEKIKKSLLDFGLELESHQSVPRNISKVVSTEKRDHFDRTSFKLTLSGDEKKVVEWLHDLQQPGNFAGYDNLTIKLDDFELVCEVRVTQWYLNRFRALSVIEKNSSDLQKDVMMVSDAH